MIALTTMYSFNSNAEALNPLRLHADLTRTLEYDIGLNMDGSKQQNTLGINGDYLASYKQI